MKRKKSVNKCATKGVSFASLTNCNKCIAKLFSLALALRILMALMINSALMAHAINNKEENQQTEWHKKKNNKEEFFRLLAMIGNSKTFPSLFMDGEHIVTIGRLLFLKMVINTSPPEPKTKQKLWCKHQFLHIFLISCPMQSPIHDSELKSFVIIYVIFNEPFPIFLFSFRFVRLPRCFGKCTGASKFYPSSFVMSFKEK